MPALLDLLFITSIGYVTYILFFQGRKERRITRISSARTGLIISDHVACAYRFFQRTTGLLNHTALHEDEALFIKPASKIHMKGMLFAIDAIFLDRENRIIHIARQLQPSQRILPISGGALTAAILEIGSGRSDELKLELGDLLRIEYGDRL